MVTSWDLMGVALPSDARSDVGHCDRRGSGYGSRGEGLPSPTGQVAPSRRRARRTTPYGAVVTTTQGGPVEPASPPGPTGVALPRGFRVRLSPRTRVLDGGGLLVGGTATGVLHLRPAAVGRLGTDRSLVADDAVGAQLCRALLDRGFADPDLDPSPAPPTGGYGEVTVVVPVHDDAPRLARLLDVLPDGLAVVVVDDASADPDALARVVAARAERLDVRLLHHATNRGPGAARNTGLAAVGTPYVVFCDADVRPVDGWLERLLAHFADPALALVAPRVLGEPTAPGERPTWLWRYEQARSSLDLGRVAAAVRPGGTVSYVPSACLAGRTASLAGGFAEALRVAEDVDLVWRLTAAGWRVRYDPEAVVRHDHRTAWGPWLRRKAYYGTGAAELARRHGDAVAPMVLTPWTAALTVAVLAQRRWSAPVALAVTGTTTVALSRRLGSAHRPLLTSARLVGGGVVATASQTAGSLTRHHWPLAVAAAVVSPRARRALVVAAVAEAVADHRSVRPDLDVVRYGVARRLDDAAYGAGLWAGAWHGRSVRALLPRVVGVPDRVSRLLRRTR